MWRQKVPCVTWSQSRQPRLTLSVHEARHSREVAFCNASWSQDKMLHDIDLLLWTDTCHILQYVRVSCNAYCKLQQVSTDIEDCQRFETSCQQTSEKGKRPCVWLLSAYTKQCIHPATVSCIAIRSLICATSVVRLFCVLFSRSCSRIIRKRFAMDTQTIVEHCLGTMLGSGLDVHGTFSNLAPEREKKTMPFSNN